jgi:hypothetical protein
MTSYDAQAAAMDDRAATAGVDEAPVGSPGTSIPTSGRIAHAYERFLKMPVGVVLALVWLAGAAFLGSCALVVYAVGSVLLRSIA